MARPDKSLTSCTKHESWSIRHGVGCNCCCFPGDCVKSMLASSLEKYLPPKKRKLQYWTQIEEEVADSDDPTVDFKLVIPEVCKICAIDAVGEVICQMTQTNNRIPDCQSESPDLTCKRLHFDEITSKPAPLQSERRPRSRMQGQLDPRPDSSDESIK